MKCNLPPAVNVDQLGGLTSVCVCIFPSTCVHVLYVHVQNVFIFCVNGASGNDNVWISSSWLSLTSKCSLFDMFSSYPSLTTSWNKWGNIYRQYILLLSLSYLCPSFTITVVHKHLDNMDILTNPKANTWYWFTKHKGAQIYNRWQHVKKNKKTMIIAKLRIKQAKREDKNKSRGRKEIKRNERRVWLGIVLLITSVHAYIHPHFSLSYQPAYPVICKQTEIDTSALQSRQWMFTRRFLLVYQTLLE